MNDRISILREAITKITQLLAGKGIKVTQRGMSAGVKHDSSGRPTEVNLPYLPDNCPEELVSAIQGFLDKEVANLLFTDYTVAVAAKKEGYVELFNIIEGIYVEKAMEKRFAGSAHNIGVMRDFFVNKYLRFEVAKLSAPGKEKELTSMLLGPAFRAIAGQSEFSRFMDTTGLMKTVQPIIDRIGSLMEEIDHVKSTAESADLARRMYDLLKGSGEGEGEGEPSEGGGKSSKSKKGGVKGEKSSKKETSGADGATDGDEKNPDGEGAGGKSEGEGEGEGEDSEDEGESEGEKGESEADSGEGESEGEDEPEQQEAGVLGNESEDKDGEEESGAGGSGSDDSEPSGERGETEYRESDMSGMIGSSPNMSDVISTITSKEVSMAAKNAEYLPYSKDDDRVEEFDIKKGYTKYQDRMLTELEDKTSHMVAPLQKDIERSISAKTQSTWQAGQRRGRLNASGLARLATGDDRVFRRKEVASSKDVAVELVIDCSGSMSGHKIQTASQTAYALSQVLERLNIKHEVIGFTTKDSELYGEASSESSSKGVNFSRTEALYMPVFKGFDERLDTNVKKRLAFLPYWDDLRNNIDGECVEIAYRRLMRRSEHRKIMIVLSDGSPACYGASAAIRKHLKDVVEGIEAAKVDIIGIGICSDAVSRFYTKNVVLDKVEELPGKVMSELKKMLVAGIK